MALAYALRNTVYNYLFRFGTSPTRPSALWLGLGKSVTDAAAGVGTEISGGSYARVDATSAFGSAPVNGVGSNDVSLTFAAPTADWATAGAPCTHFALFDASSGGNKHTGWIPLAVSRVILNGDPALIFTPTTLGIIVT